MIKNSFIEKSKVMGKKKIRGSKQITARDIKKPTCKMKNEKKEGGRGLAEKKSRRKR